MNETEIERMVVRLIGDASSYEKMMKQVATYSNRTVQQVTDAGRKIEAMQQKLEKTGIALASAGRRISLFMSTTFGTIGALAIKAGADFDQGFAGVRKTVNATEVELQRLRQDFKDLATEIPITIEELLKIGEIAGQLGIRNDNIKEFTRIIAMLGVTTNMTVEEAASQLARFANITGMSQDKFSNLASAIVELGNGSKVLGEEFKNLGAGSATTEQDIVNMAMRLAGAGTTVGMTVPQILGMATALSSVGLEAELGGTAMSRLFLEMQTAVATGDESLAVFAATSQKTIEEFVQSFRVDAAGAVQDFISGLKDLSPEERVVAIKSMGIEGIRLTDVLLRASGATELFERTMLSANQAFKANSALTKEAEERFKTFWSATTLLRNELKLTGEEAFQNIEKDLRGMIHSLITATKWFRSLTSTEQMFLITLAATAAVLGPFLILLGNLIWSVSQVVRVMGLLPTSLEGLKQAVSWFMSLHTSVGAMPWFKTVAGVKAVSTEMVHLKGMAEALDDIWDSTFQQMHDRVYNLTDATKQAKATWKDAFSSFRAWSDYEGPIGPNRVFTPKAPAQKLLETRTFTTGGGSGEFQGPMPQQKLEGPIETAKRALLEWNGVTTQAARIAGVTQKRIEGLGRAFVIVTPPMQNLTHDIFVFEGVTKRLTTTAFVLVDASRVMTTEMISLSKAFVVVTPPVQNLTHDFFVFEGVTKRLGFTAQSTAMMLSSLTTRFVHLRSVATAAQAPVAQTAQGMKLLTSNVPQMTTALTTAASSTKQWTNSLDVGGNTMTIFTRAVGEGVDIVDGSFRRVSYASHLWSSALAGVNAAITALMAKLPTLTGMLAATKAMLKFFTLELMLLTGYIIYTVVRAWTDWTMSVNDFNEALKTSIERTEKLLRLQQHQRTLRDIRLGQITDPEERRAAIGAARDQAKMTLETHTAQAEKLEAELQRVNTTWNSIKLFGSAGFAGTGWAKIEDLQTELEGVQKQAEAAEADVRHLELQLAAIPPTPPEANGEVADPAVQAAAEEAKETLDQITQSLQEQYYTFGMTAREAELWRASITQGGEAIIPILQQWDAALTELERNEALKEFNDDLKKQAETFGMTSDEILLYEMRIKGYTEEQLASAKASIEKKKALKEENDLLEEGKRVTEQYLTPLQKYKKERENLEKLLKANKISQETYNLALKAAKDEMDKLTDKEVKIKFSVQGIEAVEAGSAAALAKIEAFRAGGVAASKPVKVPMKKYARDTTAMLGRGAASGVGAQGLKNDFDTTKAATRALDRETQYQNRVTGAALGSNLDAAYGMEDDEGDRWRWGATDGAGWRATSVGNPGFGMLQTAENTGVESIGTDSGAAGEIVKALNILITLTQKQVDKDGITLNAANLGRN